MKLFLTLVAFTTAIHLHAQHYSFTNYTVKDGLAQSQVRDICQDNQGYLWIGTNSGLSKFNGIEFVNYSMDDGLPDNRIRKLYIGNTGELWVATKEGVAKFNGPKISTYYFDEDYRINDIAELKGKIYFASNTGLVEMNEEGFILKENKDEYDSYIRSIFNYKDSILICGTKVGLYTWDGNEFELLDIEGSQVSIRDLKMDKDLLYITTREKGLFSYSFDTKGINIIKTKHTQTLSFDFYNESIFGISTNDGGFLINEFDTLYFDSPNGLKGIGLKCIFSDREGNIWIGSNGKGLMKFSGTSIVSYSKEDGLSSDFILSITQDTSGDFIFGTYDAGIISYRNNEFYKIDSDDGVLKDNTVWVSRQDEFNKTWLGTSRGLTILDENKNGINHLLKDLSPKIRTIVQVENETVLLGGDEGLFIMKKDTVISLYSELNINKIYQVNEKTYCATFDGLYAFESSNIQGGYTKIALPETKVNSLTSDFHNNLWIGTENGLFVLIKEKGVFRFELDKEDYRANLILGLITTKDSSIWVSGMKGVYQIDYKKGNGAKDHEILNYGLPEGLIDEETNINAIYEDRDGFIWVGTASGLARIDPSKNKELFDYKLPQLYITGIRLFMEDFDYSEYSSNLDSVFGVPKIIQLPYNKNHITFDFIGINLKDPKSVKYEYRLIGVGDEWSPISNSNYATYSFLQPGNYTFQVRAMNKNKEWSPIQEIKIEITPPFWKTWWFLMLVIVAMILLVIYFFLARIKIIKQKQNTEKLELKNRLLFLEQRSLNASMNRHFIFNSLNSIQYFINASDKRSANKFLSNFAKLMRKNLDSSAANNFIVTLQEEIERIELYLSLEKMRFSDKFEFQIKVDPSLDTESIEIPSMILQPFVENSIIHGVLALERKGEISIRIFQELGEVVFEIMDNGLGIDVSLQSKIDGMEGDHESKGVEITNRRIEILRKLTGENMLIIGPYQINDKKGNSMGTKVLLKLGGANKYE